MCVSCTYGSLTSRSLTSSLTLAAVSVDCFPVDASLINVDRKFLHFFTFSIVSCQKHRLWTNSRLICEYPYIFYYTVIVCKCILGSVTNSTAHCYSTCRHPVLSDPLGLAQLTLLIVTEVTVVPAVWLTVLGVIPGTAAPTELWQGRHHHHNMLFQNISKPTFKSSLESMGFRAVSKLIKRTQLQVHKRKQVRNTSNWVGN